LKKEELANYLQACTILSSISWIHKNALSIKLATFTNLLKKTGCRSLVATPLFFIPLKNKNHERRCYLPDNLSKQTNDNQRCASLRKLTPGIVAVWEMSAFGGSMKHVELVDFHRKDIAMPQQSGDHSKEKPARGQDIPVDTRNRWLFGALAGASFLTLQTFLPGGPKDLALTVSLLAFAVVLPMNILLVLLTYAKKSLNDKVRLFCLSSPAVAGTFIGIDAAFWHASWYLGIVFTAASVIAFAVAFHYLP
jgi:hypothetical protein